MRDPAERLSARYERVRAQLRELFAGNPDPQSRMATAAALLHHKMPHFFWTGFYRLVDGDLLVGPYQGPLACSVLLPRGAGVCWAGISAGAPVLVRDVDEFEGHIACDSRSRSEVVVPVRDAAGDIVGVLDVDSTEIGAFCAQDVSGLERIAGMIYGAPSA
jgi:GAF domain-containing protein